MNSWEIYYSSICFALSKICLLLCHFIFFFSLGLYLLKYPFVVVLVVSRGRQDRVVGFLWGEILEVVVTGNQIIFINKLLLRTFLQFYHFIFTQKRSEMAFKLGGGDKSPLFLLGDTFIVIRCLNRRVGCYALPFFQGTQAGKWCCSCNSVANSN